MISQKQLKTILEYNYETGVFTWKARLSRRIHIGDKAGFDENGYVQICINGKSYKAHRLAWLYCYGDFPVGQIDHINRIKNDNKLSNLREATHAENGWNSKKKSNNTSGYKGVHWKRDKWAASGTLNGKKIHIGYFENINDAAKAYDLFCVKNHNEFCMHKGY